MALVVASDERVAIREEQCQILRPGRGLLQWRCDVSNGAFTISLQRSAQEETHRAIGGVRQRRPLRLEDGDCFLALIGERQVISRIDPGRITTDP